MSTQLMGVGAAEAGAGGAIEVKTLRVGRLARTKDWKGPGGTASVGVGMYCWWRVCC